MEQNLEIDWSEALGYPCKLIIAAWDKGVHWLSHTYDDIYHPEVHQEHGVNLLAPTDHPAINEWQKTIPGDVLSVLSRFKHWRVSLLQLVRNWREADDLLATNPLLLWLVREYAEEQGWTTRELQQALTLKQPVLLQTIELTGTKSANKLLKKIDFDYLDKQDSKFIRSVWQDSDILNRLSHQKRISIRLLQFYKKFPWIVGRPLSKVFDEIECSWEEKELSILVKDAFRMGTSQMNGQSAVIERRLASCSSVDAVERIHNTLVEQMHVMHVMHVEQERVIAYGLRDDAGQFLPFPNPPHPGTEQIIPIRTPNELAEEGKFMSHCAASYTEMVQTGTYFLYRMETPARLTIGVRVHEGKIIAIDQVKGRFNKIADRNIKAIVDDWFLTTRKANNSLHP